MRVDDRVLIVDDDEQFRKVLAVMLTTAGYDVQEASNGKTGLASYRRQRADVVLMDILMPEKEGLETIKELRRIDPLAKIIAMSSSGEGPSGHLSIARRFGAMRALLKPFSRDELLTMVTEVVAGRV